MAALLARSGTGDRRAFARLYALAGTRMISVVRGVVRDRAMAEEVVQETWIAIWRRAAQYRAERGEPLAWMSVIARHQAIDRLRAERARGFVCTMEEPPEMAVEGPGAGLTLECLALRRAFGGLKAEYRRALELAFVDGYTHAEVAGVMAVPVGTAKTWVRRGLIALRAAME
ncbi:MAG: sigma-70 family RNA polymerase sigma factor [Pseudomonadota bacterium]